MDTVRVLSSLLFIESVSHVSIHVLCRPDVVFAGYSLEHPVYRHMNLRIQTRDEATKSSEHVLVDSLKTTQSIIGCVGDSMDEAMAAWQKDS